jgi:hypothetical protein
VRPGDFNQDGGLDISDVVAYLMYLFSGRTIQLPCGGASANEGLDLLLLDVNGDATVNIADPVHLLAHLFQGGPPPALGRNCIQLVGCPSTCRQ